MEFQLVIANKITTKVKGYYVDERSVERPFNFELMQDRLPQDEIKAVYTDRTEDASAFIKRITHGWSNQRLVLDADSKPAEFSPEALDMLLSIAGMGGYCYQAYMEQTAVHAKN
jgi:hypothetical protein